MKITEIFVFHIQPRWMLVKVCTDSGLCGWGEPTLEGRATVVQAAIETLRDYLIGQDPFCIEHLYELLYRGGFYRSGAVIYSAISGIEQALWDIKGKALGVPVWQLLGGKCRDKIRMYAHITPANDDPDPDLLCDAVAFRLAQGFTALKTPVFAPVRHIDTLAAVERVAKKLEIIREAAGKDVDIAIDFHGRISPAMAPRLCKALEVYYPMFVEEPVLPENTDAMVKVSQSTTIPIATGERLFTTFSFREVLEKQAASVLQPDLCHCGGILQAFKIAAMAENYYCSIAPHNPLGPVALAACLQLDTCIPNFTAQEHPTLPDGHDLGAFLFEKSFVIRDGYIDVPEAPGLGFTINEDAVREFSYDGKWKNAVFFFPDDNSLAEW